VFGGRSEKREMGEREKKDEHIGSAPMLLGFHPLVNKS
jgi:hypothetical protein